MKISVKADVVLEVELKDVLAFLIEEKLTPQQYEAVILEAMRRKQGFFTHNDQRKYEIFDEAKSKYTPEELEQRLL